MKKIFILFALLFMSNLVRSQITLVYDTTITFETPYEYIEIDTSAQNIWQIGEPQKIIFDSAYSPTNAILTDTINNYPINNYSYFDLYLGEFNMTSIFWGERNIEITHKYNTDEGFDGGYITISYDMGSTWMNIIKDTVWYNMYFHSNIYTNTDTLFNGEFGFSGSSNGWITTNLEWIIPICKDMYADTVILRFNFISDSVETAKEGWMIDNVRLYQYLLGGSINENSQMQYNVYPNPVQERAKISFNEMFNDIEVRMYNLQGQLLKQEYYMNSRSVDFETENAEHGTYIISVFADGQDLGKLLIEIL